MAAAVHEPEWPDKAMFSAMILTLAGAIGVLFGLLAATGATIGGDDSVVGFLKEWPVWAMLPASVVALVFGVLGVRHQSSAFVYIGNIAGLASLGALGLVPILCIASIAFMVRAHVEGEDTTLATPVPSADEWPDKAMGASMLLFVTGLLTLFQSILTFADRFSPVLFNNWVWGAWAAVVAIVCLVAAREVYRLRRPWFGSVAAVAGILGMGFYALGPVLCITALVLLALADREDEFVVHTDA